MMTIVAFNELIGGRHCNYNQIKMIRYVTGDDAETVAITINSTENLRR